jgi:RNA polymerase sigma-70 factor (ECF subfamily)
MSTSFLARLKSQEPQAWERLVDLYGAAVYAWCRRAKLQPPDSADVLQEVFRAVAANVAGFQPDSTSGSFYRWLKAIARSKICDHYRRRHNQPVAIGGSEAQQRFEDLSDDNPDDNAQYEEDRASEIGVMHRGLAVIRAEFEDRTWQAFWLTVVESLSAPEAAAQLGMKPAAVRQCKCRVLHRLRQALGDVE